MTTGFDHGGSRRLPEGRPEPVREDPHFLHSVHRRIEIRPHPPRGPHEMMFVAKSVGLYLVPSIADLPDQFGVRGHLLAQTEEGGP